MSSPAYIITPGNVSIIIKGKVHNVTSTHVNYDAVLKAIAAKDFDSILELVDLKSPISKYINDTGVSDKLRIDLDSGQVTYDGNVVHNTMVARILELKAEGFPVEPLVKLLSNLYTNPSKKAIDELYSFLEYGKMPITEDGHFLAYKRVNDNYTSCYDNKTANDIGTVVSMPRYEVDDRSSNTCSSGLHICSFEYLQHYRGARVIIVKVNPADVVSIPVDYNNTKARTCRYEVIGELTPEEAGLETHSFGTPVYTTKEYADHEDMLQDNEPEEDEYDGFPIIEKPQEQQNVSDWYKHGYTIGYNSGKKKLPFEDFLDVTPDEDDAIKTNMSLQDINDVNTSFNEGYKDGRGHKSRKYPKFEIPL